MVKAKDLDDVMALLYHAGNGIDMCEFCGGEGRPSKIAIRRNLKAGKNFDLVCGIDLGQRRDQQQALAYLESNHVLVVVMAPSCRSMGPTAHVNYRINYSGWKKLI